MLPDLRNCPRGNHLSESFPSWNGSVKPGNQFSNVLFRTERIHLNLPYYKSARIHIRSWNKKNPAVLSRFLQWLTSSTLCIIPQKSHVANLLVAHYHSKVRHQGRLITGTGIRTSGFRKVGAKRLVSSILHKCVIYRKLRDSFLGQRMADLPSDRVTPSRRVWTVDGGSNLKVML